MTVRTLTKCLSFVHRCKKIQKMENREWEGENVGLDVDRHRVNLQEA